MEILTGILTHVGEPAIGGAVGALLMYTFVVYPRIDAKIERIEKKVDKIYDKLTD